MYILSVLVGSIGKTTFLDKAYRKLLFETKQKLDEATKLMGELMETIDVLSDPGLQTTDFNIVKHWEQADSFRAQIVVGSYTLSDVKLEKHFKGSLPIEADDWQVGIIVGRSGSGKTSIVKQLFPEAYIRGFEYSHKCVLNDFPEELETGEITKTLCSVGFASPPDWLKSYDCLSQGEKMRVDIARALCLNQQQIVFDEFTSVVDREIAKVCAFAIIKAVRKSSKKFIAVTCHYDVIDWLDPDWVFCTDTMEFSRKKELGRPLNSKSVGAAIVFGRCFGNITT